jgi:hypothetical protein
VRILFEQIYYKLVSSVCALLSNFGIFSQILGALCALRRAPNFYEIHPRLIDNTMGSTGASFTILT